MWDGVTFGVDEERATSDEPRGGNFCPCLKACDSTERI